MHKCIMVKIWETKRKTIFAELKEKRVNLAKIGEFINFVEIGGNIQYASLG